MRTNDRPMDKPLDRLIITLKENEAAGRFGNWDSVEFDKKTGETKKVERPKSRPVNSKNKDRIIVSDPDGEGCQL